MLAATLSPVAPFLVASGAILLVAASLHDIAARTIPDPICAALVGMGMLLRLADDNLGSGLLAAMLVLVLALLCCLRGWMGGGDAKLLAAVALLLPPARVPDGIVAIALAGGLLGLLYLALRRLVPPPGPRPVSLLARAWRAERFRLRRGGPLPYGVGIAAGAILVLLGAV